MHSRTEKNSKIKKVYKKGKPKDIPTVTCGSEPWVLKQEKKLTLLVWERKRNKTWKHRINEEIINLHSDVKITSV